MRRKEPVTSRKREPEVAPVEISPDDLAPETLRRVVEEFITREGTDYGLREASLDAKVADVIHQLEVGEARIVFDPEIESVNIVPRVPTSRRSLLDE